jgi:two-component system heavy metal sensor histidine kinase CusS
MFWKRADGESRGAARPRGMTSWPIAVRLAVLYSTSAFAMVLLATAFLYWAFNSDLTGDDDEFLTDKMRVVQDLLREHGENSPLLKHQVTWEAVTSHSIEPNYARILSASGRVLLETPDMSQLIPVSAFPPPVAATTGRMSGLNWRSPDGHSYRLLSARMKAATGDAGDTITQVAMGLSHENELIARNRRMLFIVLPLGVVLSAAIGAVVARQGMRPLKEIAHKAHNITASQLHERLYPDRWPPELGELATAFDQMLERLEQSFVRLSEFSADLAHELRTPINNLMGEAQVALSKPRSVEEYREALESSLEEYERLSRMIESLLFLARADNSQIRPDTAVLDVREELESIREFYDAVAAEQAIDVRCEGEGVVEADASLLRRALSNLLSNAVSHTPRGGRISLGVDRPDQGWVEIRVSDSGCGIAAEHLPKIFDRFYRADASRSAPSEGAGLGLALVKAIMTLHGGNVVVRSSPGQGTTVSLRFPSTALST